MARTGTSRDYFIIKVIGEAWVILQHERTQPRRLADCIGRPAWQQPSHHTVPAPRLQSHFEQVAGQQGGGQLPTKPQKVAKPAGGTTGPGTYQ